MTSSHTRVAVEVADERRVVTLVRWRRRLYQVALPLGIVGAVIQVLDLATGGLGGWARAGDVAILLSLLIPFVLLGAPDKILGRVRPADDPEDRTSR
jgi:hypothetical protein